MFMQKVRDRPELMIKTHYEGLDIAGSRKIFYLRFGLNDGLSADKENELQEWVRQEPIKAITKDRINKYSRHSHK